MNIVDKWLTEDLHFPMHLNLKSAVMADARYSYVSNFVKNKFVLDVGCGLGNGACLISHDAQVVVSIDISKDALAYGRRRYREKNLQFICASASYLPFRNCSFEVVLGFEIMEHVKDPAKFLSESNRVLKNKNIFVMSTPNKLVTSPFWKKPLNPVHIQEFTPQQIQALLSKYFVIHDFKGQLIKTKSALVKDYISALAGNTLNTMKLKRLKKVYRLLIGRSVKTVRREDYAVKTFTPNVCNIIVICKKLDRKNS